MKCCLHCKITLPLEDFHNQVSSPDGKRKVCKSCRKIESNKRYEKHKDKIKAQSRIDSSNYYYANREVIKEKMKIRERAYGPRRNELRRIKRQTNPEYRIVTCLRARLGGFVTGTHKSAPTLELLGCTLEELRKHLESLWQTGMNWDNHGFGDDKWHIDHKRPCASFDLNEPAQQRECFHYSNLQPMWQKDNISKGSFYNGKHH
jgi:hypothetical protein